VGHAHEPAWQVFPPEQSPLLQQLVAAMQTAPHALVDAAHVHVLALHEKPPAHPASAQQSSPSVPHVPASPGIASRVAASLVSVVASVGAGAESAELWSPGATRSCVASPPPSGCFALASGVVPLEPVPAQPQTIAAAISPMAKHVKAWPMARANGDDASG
jgi:hypothetical protein